MLDHTTQCVTSLSVAWLVVRGFLFASACLVQYLCRMTFQEFLQKANQLAVDHPQTLQREVMLLTPEGPFGNYEEIGTITFNGDEIVILPSMG